MAFPPPYGHRIGGYFAVHTVSVLMQHSYRRVHAAFTPPRRTDSEFGRYTAVHMMSCLTFIDIRTVHLGFCCCPYDMRAHTAFTSLYEHRIGGYFAVHTVSVLIQRLHRRAGQIASLEDILQSIMMSCLTLDIRTVHLGFYCCPYGMRAHTAFTSPYEHRIERIFRCMYNVNLVTPYWYPFNANVYIV